jgi:AcrR family transcriptional regulator
MPRKPAAPPPSRRERARQTRQRIVAAAAESVLAHGYAATTMAGVARSAGVAVQTVYFTFHTKAALFMEVVLQLSAGPDGETPVMERAWVKEAHATPGPARALALMVEHGTDIFRRLMPAWDAIAAASAEDRDFAVRFAAVVAARRQGMRALLGAVAARGGLGAGVSAERAADTFFLLQSPQLLSLAGSALGWSVERFKAWVYASMLPLLAEGALDGAAVSGMSFAAELAAYMPTAMLSPRRSAAASSGVRRRK